MKAGWHLWCVSLCGRTDSLWITTSTRNFSQAWAKAETFLRTALGYRDEQVKIRGIEHRGTIDA